MSESVRGDDNFIYRNEPFNADLGLAFARLVTHGNGGSFRLTRAMMVDLGDVKITRVVDQSTGDIVFTVSEAAK